MGVIPFLLGRVTLCVEPSHSLEQMISLLPNSLGFHVILACLFSQGHNLLLCLDGVPVSVLLPSLEIGHLLGSRGKLSYPLVSNDKLRS
jgi:hypothetical protein